MAVKAIGRSVQKVLRESLKESKPKWRVITPKKKARQVCDILVSTGKLNVMVKVKTTKGDHFRYSTFSESQLDMMHRFAYSDSENISLVFFYFADDRELVSVDIEELVRIKANKLTQGEVKYHGYVIDSWETFGRYLTALRSLKSHQPKRRNPCQHYWVLESLDEAFRRTRSRRYSMGHCINCGAVKLRFDNRLKTQPLQL